MKKKNKVKIASARAGNVIGGGDWSNNRIIPDYIKSIQNNKSLNIRNPKSTRPWQHVLEPLHGYLKLASELRNKKAINGQSFNFGPKKYDNKTVIDVIKEVKKNIDKGSWKITRTNKQKNKEAKLLYLNSNKAKKYLNWKSLLSFSEGIKFTSDWYKSYLTIKGKKRIITFDQIDKYMKIARNRRH